MKILIHACPQRMWYVQEFLAPALQAQGADDIEIWNDSERRGNLASCMASFAARSGDGGTWHIQDDVLPCRDFVQRCRENDEGVAYGFCNEHFTDDPQQTGTVYVEDAWHSFQCVRIPDAYARACASWLEGSGREHEQYPIWIASGKMDDAVFRSWLIAEHSRETVQNLKPNLVEHVDWLVGGSILSEWRGYLTRAYYWDDEDLVQALRRRIRARVQI